MKNGSVTGEGSDAMFKIMMLLLLIIVLVLMLKHEKRIVKILLLTYFIVLSIVFMSGSIYISSEKNLYDGPAADGGFAKHFEWVSHFSLLYMVPLFCLLGYKLYKLTQRLMNRTWLKWLTFGAGFAGLTAISYIALFIFILIFYGFAP
ncbi:hypothetical protein [Lentibacillus salinarum]|uniref:DUF420 domain-containing protein n=1 Tax=Lentibacillus salinarum TaxID=446820 RepID=A0ABW3ZT60_9BACI